MPFVQRSPQNSVEKKMSASWIFAYENVALCIPPTGTPIHRPTTVALSSSPTDNYWCVSRIKCTFSIQFNSIPIKAFVFSNLFVVSNLWTRFTPVCHAENGENSASILLYMYIQYIYCLGFVWFIFLFTPRTYCTTTYLYPVLSQRILKDSCTLKSDFEYATILVTIIYVIYFVPLRKL